MRVNVPVLLGVGVRVLVNVGETTGVFVAVPQEEENAKV